MLTPPDWPALSELTTCEFTWQLTIQEPVKESPPDWLGEDVQMSAPRTNLVVSKQSLSSDDPFEMAEQFIQQSRNAIPRMEMDSDISDFVFDDENVGAAVDISFEAIPNLRLRQRHVFRRDDNVQVQFVVTMEPGAADTSFNTFLEALRAYVPN